MSKILELPEIQNLIKLEKELSEITLSEEDRLAIVEKIKKLSIYEFSSGLTFSFDYENHPLDSEDDEDEMVKIRNSKISEEMKNYLKTFRFISNVLSRDGEYSYKNYYYYSKELGIVAYTSESYNSWGGSDFEDTVVYAFALKIEYFEMFVARDISLNTFFK